MLLDRRERRCDAEDLDGFFFYYFESKKSHVDINYMFPIIPQGVGGIPGIDGLPGDKGDQVRKQSFYT